MHFLLLFIRVHLLTWIVMYMMFLCISTTVYFIFLQIVIIFAFFFLFSCFLFSSNFFILFLYSLVSLSMLVMLLLPSRVPRLIVSPAIVSCATFTGPFLASRKWTWLSRRRRSESSVWKWVWDMRNRWKLKDSAMSISMNIVRTNTHCTHTYREPSNEYRCYSLSLPFSHSFVIRWLLTVDCVFFIMCRVRCSEDVGEGVQRSRYLR